MKKFLCFLFSVLITLGGIAHAYPLIYGSGEYGEIVRPSTATLSDYELMYSTINNYGQTGNAVITLSACRANRGFDVLLGTTAAFHYRIDPNGTELIFLDGTSCGAGKYVGIASAVQGNGLSCRSYQTSAGVWSWYCVSVSGAWACEP